MAAHKERFEAFVDDDRSWEQHISAMRNNGTYGGHLELTAFAQLKVVNVKVVQPGLVYVIEGAKTDDFGPSTSASAAPEEDGSASSKDKRKAKKDRMKKKAADKAADEEYDDDEEEGGSAPFPATVYVAYVPLFCHRCCLNAYRLQLPRLGAFFFCAKPNGTASGHA